MMNLILAGLGLFALTQNKTPVPTSGPQGPRNRLADGNTFYPQNTTAEREVPEAATFSDMVDSLQERAVSAVNQISANPAAVFNDVRAMNVDSILDETATLSNAALTSVADQDNEIVKPTLQSAPTPTFLPPPMGFSNDRIIAVAGPASTAPITPVATSSSGVNTLEGRQVLPEVTSIGEFSLASQAQQNALSDARNTLKSNSNSLIEAISNIGKPQRYMPPAKTAEQLEWERIVADNPQLKRFL